MDTTKERTIWYNTGVKNNDFYFEAYSDKPENRDYDCYEEICGELKNVQEEMIGGCYVVYYWFENYVEHAVLFSTKEEAFDYFMVKTREITEELLSWDGDGIVLTNKKMLDDGRIQWVSKQYEDVTISGRLTEVDKEHAYIMEKIYIK